MLLAVVAVLNVPAYFSTSMVYAAEASAPETQKLAKSGDVASDPAVRALMKSAMGSDLYSYDDFSQLTAEPEVSGDDIIVTSGVRGLFTISETFLVVNPVKKTCFVGVMEDGKTMNLYGPATTVGQLPKLAQDFLADLQKRSGTTQKLVFKKPGTKQASTSKTTKKEVLAFESVTGKYEKVGKFDGGTLLVKELSANKIKFSLSCANGAHTGEASGTLDLKVNKATYKDDGFVLNFTFTPRQINIEGKGEGFGAIGVVPDGSYKKVSEIVSDKDF